ncbi:MAG: protein kinase, partial [Myxococcota bacterium]
MERSTRFELISKLGEGGMGVVYEAHDRKRNMRVALKQLRKLDASNLYQFKREFRALSDLSHPNIVHLHELVSEPEEDRWFLSMELVDGTDFIGHVRSSRWEPSSSDDAEALDTNTDRTMDTRVVNPVSRRAGTVETPVVAVAPGEIVDIAEIV